MSNQAKGATTAIENRKHFNAILVSLKTVNDILKNIDQLCASKYCSMPVLCNSIRLKAPEVHQAFTNYLCTYKRGTANTSFAEWAVAEKVIPVEIIEAAKNGNNIKSLSELRVAQKNLQTALKKAKLTVAQNIRNNSIPACPYCGKKFRPETSETLATHSCRKTTKTHKSVWVISGGGANGIRNKR